jgi:GT2 family glycosyltransferase
MAGMISIVFVSYHSGREILNCLDSIAASGTLRPLEIIVVDNASADDSVKLLGARLGIHLITNEENLGLSRAVNQGLRVAQGDYLLVLNPDILVKPGSLDALADFLDANPKAGMAGAKLLNEDGSLQYSCRSFYTLWTILLRRTPLGKLFKNSKAIRRHLMLDYDHETPAKVDWILGACMMTHRRALADVGGMDERFFLYFEDVDWCYRMDRRGWEVWYAPSSEITHIYRRASARNPFSRSLLAHISSFFHYYEKWNPVSYLAKRYRNPVKVLGLLILDALALAIALAAAVWFRVSLAAGLFSATYFEADPYLRFAPFFLGVNLVLFHFMGLYRIDRRTPQAEEFISLLKAELLAPVVLLAANFLTGEDVISRSIIVLSAPMAILFVMLLRGSLRGVHRRLLRLNFDLRRLLMVGSAEEQLALDRRVRERPQLGLDLVGRLDPMGLSGSLGDLTELERVATEERVQEILIASSAATPASVAAVLPWCRARNVELRVLGDLAGVMNGSVRVQDFLDQPGWSYRMGGGYSLLLAAKRLTDILVSLLFLLISALPGLVFALTRRLQGRKAYAQLNFLGRRGKPAYLPLARAEGRGAVSDLLNPGQYLAVLRGHFSLVGPQPISADSGGDAPTLRPGLTGYWRLAGEREEESLLSRDRFYMHNWSPGEDLRIWSSTLPSQLRGRYPASFLRSVPT